MVPYSVKQPCLWTSSHSTIFRVSPLPSATRTPSQFGGNHDIPTHKRNIFLRMRRMLVGVTRLPKQNRSQRTSHKLRMRKNRPCNTSVKSHQHSNTPSPHHGAQCSLGASSTANGPPKGYTIFANTVTDTRSATTSNAPIATRKYYDAHILNTL